MKLLKVILQALYFYFTKRNRKVDFVGQKVVYLDISSSYTRHLYCMLKCLNLSGYKICIRPRLKLLAELLGGSYTDLLFEEGAQVGKPVNYNELVVIDDSFLKREYYQTFLLEEPNPEIYHVPQTMHPLIYHLGKWDEPVEESTRVKALVLLGNFDPVKYDNTLLKKIFKVESRRGIYDLLIDKPYYKKVTSNEGFFEPDSEGKVMLVPTGDVSVGITEIRSHFSKFEFFFALPGDKTPLCHNLIEAMSVGAIPFMEQPYADLFDDPLEDGVNAIIYNGREDMLNKIPEVLNMDNAQISKLRKGVEDYYKEHLTPQAIANKIVNKGYKRIYLQSGNKGLNPLYKLYQ